ncbi:YccF domain-containing protein [Bacillus massiliigorillae]|uniref:YccF domain-containing protein n=1 Tax=Bacillus massiliigorillae TaxID=1243664 RepID=UPI00039A6A24|nr:YccF domain-containing protein [Bacillus massiliigorillae]
MSCLGNILWFIFGGFFNALGWLLIGGLWCITIVGIPVGLQCFKMAKLQLAPFGKDIVTVNNGFGSLLLNILWIVFGGLALAIANLVSALLLAITIIGIPFALQSLKMAQLSLMPFGKEVR